MPAEFFKLMGVEPPPEKEEYFIDLDKHLKDHFQIKPETKEAYEIRDQLNRCVQRPWIAKENPELASWLKANEKPLALVMEAIKRTQYFSPLVPVKTEKGSSGLIGALQTGTYKSRELANALVARAMLGVGQGANDKSWQDLLACHRLGRLVERGPTLIDGIVGIGIDRAASKADLAFIERTKLNAKQFEMCLRDVQKLPAMSGLAGKVDLACRFEFLDNVIMMDREGLNSLEDLVAKALQKDPNALPRAILANTSLDPAFKYGNHWYDRMGAAYREKDRGLRQKKLEQIDEEIKILKPDWEKELKQLRTDVKKLQDEGAHPEAVLKLVTERSMKLIGTVVFALSVPSVSKLQNSWDGVRQNQENVTLAFALEWYQRDNRRYPQKLEDLAPKYLKEIPLDIFSRKPLIYRPSEKGYLLYSVGYSGKDEGGRTLEDDPIGWNISVRMPLPELPKK